MPFTNSNALGKLRIVTACGIGGAPVADVSIRGVPPLTALTQISVHHPSMRSLRIARARRNRAAKASRVVPRIDGLAGGPGAHYLARRSRSGPVAEPVDGKLIIGW